MEAIFLPQTLLLGPKSALQKVTSLSFAISNNDPGPTRNNGLGTPCLKLKALSGRWFWTFSPTGWVPSARDPSGFGNTRRMIASGRSLVFDGVHQMKVQSDEASLPSSRFFDGRIDRLGLSRSGEARTRRHLWSLWRHKPDIHRRPRRRKTFAL